MMKLLALILASLLFNGVAPQCPDDYVSVGNRCLLFLTDGLYGYDSAKFICTENGGHLVDLDDCSLLGEISDYLITNDIDDTKQGFWTGAYGTEGNGTFFWSDGSVVPMGAPFWARGPDYVGEPQLDGENCVVMFYGDGFYFHNYECSESLVPLCQSELTDGECPPRYTEIRGKCYQAEPAITVDWETGNAVCESSSGSLAVVDDCSAINDIVQFITDSDVTTSVWIGGFRVGDSWQWTTGDPMAMGVPFWGRDGTGDLEPRDDSFNHRCIELWAFDRYYFNDVQCDEIKFPICELNGSAFSTSEGTTTEVLGTTAAPRFT